MITGKLTTTRAVELERKSLHAWLEPRTAMAAGSDKLTCMRGLCCQRLALFACVVFAAVVAGWSRWTCLHAAFTYDDQVTVQNNPVVRY